MRALLVLAAAIAVASAQTTSYQGAPPPVQASVGTSTGSWSTLKGQPLYINNTIIALSGNSTSCCTDYMVELVFNSPNRWGDMNTWSKTLPMALGKATSIFQLSNTSIGLVGPNFTAALDMWGNVTWTAWCSQCTTATPTLINGNLFVRANNNSGTDNLYRLDVATGAVMWSRQISNVGNSYGSVSWSANASNIIVGSYTNIDCVDIATGNSSWTYSAVSYVYQLLEIPGGNIIYTTGSYIYMIAANGTRVYFGAYNSLYKSTITTWKWINGQLWVAGDYSVYVYTALPNSYDMISVTLPNSFYTWLFDTTTNQTLLGTYTSYGRLLSIPFNVSTNGTNPNYVYSINDYRGSGFTSLNMFWMGSQAVYVGGMSGYTYMFNLTSNTTIWRLTSGMSGAPFTTNYNNTWRLIVPYSSSMYLNSMGSPVGTLVNSLYRAYLFGPTTASWWASTSTSSTSSYNGVTQPFQFTDGSNVFSATSSNGLQMNTWTGATMFSASSMQSTGFLLQNMSFVYLKSSSYDLVSYNWSDISMVHAPGSAIVSPSSYPVMIAGDGMWFYVYSNDDQIYVGNSYNGQQLSKKASKVVTGTLSGFGAYDKKYWYGLTSSRNFYIGDADPTSVFSATLTTSKITIGASVLDPYFLTGPFRYGGTIYAADSYGQVYAWGRSTGSAVFKTQITNGTNWFGINMLLPFNNQLFAITTSTTAYIAALTANGGSTVWTWYDYRYTISSAQIFDDGTMWVRATRGGYSWTIGIDTTATEASKRVLFERSMRSGMATMLNGVVYQIQDSDTIVGMDAYTGAQLLQIWMDYDYSSCTFIKASNWTNAILIGTSSAGVISVQVPGNATASAVTPKAAVNFAPSNADPTEEKSNTIYIIIAIIIVVVIIIVIAVLCCRKKSSVAPAPDGYQQHTNVNGV